jgi:hypothetical protein
MSNEWVRPPDEIDDPISTFFSGGEFAPFYAWHRP